MAKGKVNKIVADRGFGFITGPVGHGDVFLHGSECVGGFDVFNSLKVGDEVEYEIENGSRGPVAKSVRYLPSDCGTLA